MSINTDLAAAFATAGFRVTSIDDVPGRMTEADRVARIEASERRALAKHRKRVANFMEEYEAMRARANTAPPQEPTAARRIKGMFACMTLEGAKVEIDMHAFRLDKMRDEGLITAEQCQGGHDFAALMDRMRMVPAGRSCLDNSPRGFEENSEPSHYELRDAAERKVLYAACGALVWAELRRCCVEQLEPRRITRLRQGLDACVKLWA